MVYEKHVRSIPALQRELRLLDGDAGMRVKGNYAGKSCFTFVTRFGETYTLMVFAARDGGGGGPGRKLTTKEFRDIDSTVSFLRSIAGPAVDACVY